MKIYTMTATFGKLERQTLTLQPGLNVIEAPNEWGKSTWCAFLITMLYGLDTRAKSTKTALADKEKYTPWSGSAMSGRIDLQWNGRNITIERMTRGRTPMGAFRAYETASGLDVPELTATNCGQILLGVERSVFRRTAFIRQPDMPVTQDDVLRRRLNDLVTTGDETGESDRLAEQLKELKNRCRYNRTGLLPQAEEKQRELEEKLRELESLELHSRNVQQKLQEGKTRQMLLENHRDALQYAEAEADAARVAQARDRRDRAEQKLLALEQQCAGIPSAGEVEKKIAAMEAYLAAQKEWQTESGELRPKPQPPVPPEVFRGMTPAQASETVSGDSRRYLQLQKKNAWRVAVVASVLCMMLAALALLPEWYPAAGIAGVLGIVLMILGIRKKSNRDRQLRALEEKYGSALPEAWLYSLRIYEAELAAYEQELLKDRVSRGDLDIRATFLQKQRETLFGSQTPQTALAAWQRLRELWQARDAAAQEFRMAEDQLKLLTDMAKPAVSPPAMADELTFSVAQTQSLLAEARAQQQHLQGLLGQYRGRMEALGSREALQKELQAVKSRIESLENTFEAVSLALDTLNRARQELQRKFAPRISGRAQELLRKMTDGRYDRMTLAEDLSLLAGTAEEPVLRETLWRSDGTVDQLYMALRLAVAEELTPDAPLVLDDAFVRFDDRRLKAVLKILEEEARHRQVILFTCQKREKELLTQ